MNFARRQRGQLLVAGIVLIVVVALMISALGFLYVSNQSASTLHDSSGTAYYAARSGIEVASYQYSTGASCAALASGAQAVGTNASFSIAAASYNVSPPTVNNATINISQTVIPIGAGVIGSYAPSGRVRIEAEEIDYSAISTDSAACSGSPPCLIVAKRGAAGTAAAAHAAKPVYQDVCHIRSTGTSGAATRFVDRAFHPPLSMMGYAKYGSGATAAQESTAYYQLWNGSAWGGEGSALIPATQSPIEHAVIQASRTRNETLMATVSSNGNIRLRVWDGFKWSFATGPGMGADGLLATMTVYTPQSRAVDLAYETANDRAIVVYNNAGNRNPVYRVWDGSTLSAAVALNTDLGTNYATSGSPQWIKLAADPVRTSNEIVMITLDSNRDTWGVRWNGTVWSKMEAGAAAVWEANVSDTATCTAGGGTTCEAVVAAYEQVSGRAMFIWANNSTGNFHYALWNGTTLTASPFVALNIAAMGGIPRYLYLAPRPGSNQLLFGATGAGSDLNTRLWSGTAWDTATKHPEHDGTVEITTNRIFSLVFETHLSQAGKAWLFWGDGSRVSRKQWDPALNGACIGGTGSCWTSSQTQGDDTSLVDMIAHPTTGDIFALFYESSGAGTPEQILEVHSLGGASTWSWTANGTNPAGAYVVWNGRADSTTNPAGRTAFAVRAPIRIVTQEYFP